MITPIITFDLNDTLANTKIKVYHQTYHILNKFKKQELYHLNYNL